MKTSTRINEFDLLRLIAALSVMFFHYTFRGNAADALSEMSYPILAPISKYGYLGVELFFMISGFVILMTATKGSLKDFVVSRLVRLYPAFWICCTITFVMIIFIGGTRYSATINQYLINMTLLNDFINVPNIDGAYWSLFVEIRFYILIAILLLIRRTHQAQIFLILWLIISVSLEIIPIGRLRYLLIVDYSAYFIAGSTYFLIWSQGISLAKISIIIFSFGLALFQAVNGLANLEKKLNTSMSVIIIIGIITLFYLIMLLISLRKTGILGRKQLLLIGALTYPLYLLHQYVGYMLINAGIAKINPHILLASTIIMVIGTAYAVNKFIENKFSLALRNAINFLIDIFQRQIKKITSHFGHK